MKLHPTLAKRVYKSFSEIEKLIEELETSKEKGDAFEDFVYCYLQLNKQKYQINEVYRIQDAPEELLAKYKIERSDAGVDGLFVKIDGEVSGYQAKFRSNRIKPPYHELAKFWVESRHTDLRYTIANSYDLTALSEKEANHFSILAGEFDGLDKHFFNALYEFAKHKPVKRQLFTPRPYQQEIIKDVVEGFENSERGKFIAACGIGKTLVSLWISEAMKSQKVLFLAPSLALIKQTLEEWAQQTSVFFEYLCICSDETVSKDLEDYGDITIAEMDVPVSTDISQIVAFLNNDTVNKQIIFCTYQSLKVLSDSLKGNPEIAFDIAIFDEAHRTAGANLSGMFNLGLDDDNIKCRKRLFMTATERMLMPRVIDKAEEENRIVFSMNDTDIYGEVFHRLSFGQAIQQGIISDYRIVVTAIREKEVFDWIKLNTQLEDDSEGIVAFGEVLFSQMLLSKATKTLSIRKTLTFHSSIKNSQMFAFGKFSNYDLMRIITQFNPDIRAEDIFVDHIDGSFSAGKRREILNKFKSSMAGVISNSRCLTEGVDVPVIDSIYFVDPKNSLIDIVQACGRALRKPIGVDDKISYIIIPVLIPEGIEGEELLNSDRFENIYNVIQSLRDQDERLEQWVDLLNQNAARGKYTTPKWNPLEIELPKDFDINVFEQSLLTRIAIVNSESTKKKFSKTKIYNQGERRSKFTRAFRTIGDYSVRSFKDSLVDPTIAKFTSDMPFSNSVLKINNNNVSHTFRLGLIEKVAKKNYKLTPLGKNYKNSVEDFESIFKKQMMRFYVKNENQNKERLFPYRSFLSILMEVKKVNYLHFAYCLCTMVDSNAKSLKDALSGIELINREIPNPEFLNEKNQNDLLSELNQVWSIDYSYEDIWTNKTTLYNQWIYFRNHLILFDGVIWNKNDKSLEILGSKTVSLRGILEEELFLGNTADEKALYSYYIGSSK